MLHNRFFLMKFTCMWSNYSKTEALPRSGVSALVFQSSFLGDWDHWWRREMSTLSPRGVLLGILVGVCRPTLQILTLCTSDQKMWVCTPVFRPGGSHKTPYISLLRLEHQQKGFFKIKREWANTFRHCRRSLKNNSRFQTNMGRVYACFQTNTGPKPHP